MTRSHAKNNTTQANLSYYERSLLRVDGAARRIGNDSFKPLDHCNLCLTQAKEPVACPSAHVYCRECAIANLISQLAGIEAQRRELERWEIDDNRKRAEARDNARSRVVTDFERGMGLGVAFRSSNGGAATGVHGVNSQAKHKFELSDEAIERIAQEAEEKAMATIEAEQTESRKSKLAAFWLPTLTPEAPLGPLKNVKLQTLCHVGGSPHPLSRKSLLPVIFTYPSTSTAKPSCPSCTKELSNATPAILLSSHSPAVADADRAAEEPKKKKAKKVKSAEAVCGHVVCKTCADTVIRPSARCCVCEAAIEETGMIPLGKEGTGFAAAGGAIVKKATVTFRV